MRARLRAKLLAGVLVLASVPLVVALVPASAQAEFDVSFDTFHDELGRYGGWFYSDRWGMVWQPQDVSEDFRPYDTDGHWVYTDDYGWMWVSDYPWGDITFHYGRWVDDPDDGWLWIPGYTWSPAWVVWRSNDNYLGWMPMPPDNDFMEGGDVSGASISFSWGDDPMFGYRRWYGPDYDEDRFARNWVFINIGHMGDRDYHRYETHDPRQVVNIIHQTTNITNYTVINNYVVNKSVNVHVVERAAGHPIQAMPARAVIRRPELMATVAAGRQARDHWRGIVPVGHGVANSAPPPPPQVVQRLSTNVRPHGGHALVHLFTKTTVTAPQAASHFHGAPPRGAPPNGAPPSQMMQHENGRGAPPEQHGPSGQPMMGTPPENRGHAPATNEAPPSQMMQHENRRGTPPEERGPSGQPMMGTPPENRGHMPAEHAPSSEHPPETMQHVPPPEESRGHAPPAAVERGHAPPPHEDHGHKPPPPKDDKHDDNPH